MNQEVIITGFEIEWKDLDSNSDLSHTPTTMKQHTKFLVSLI